MSWYITDGDEIFVCFISDFLFFYGFPTFHLSILLVRQHSDWHHLIVEGGCFVPISFFSSGSWDFLNAYSFRPHFSHYQMSFISHSLSSPESLSVASLLKIPDRPVQKDHIVADHRNESSIMEIMSV
jgi:hypothetical protein